MNIGVIILSRYESRRLPGKALVDLGGRPALGWVVERVRAANPALPIVIATSDQAGDDPIARYAVSVGVPVHRGSLQDVARRFLDCAKGQGFDFAVRINGDNVMLDPPTLRAMVELAATDSYDFVSNVTGRSFPRGMSVEILRTAFYEGLLGLFDRTEWCEHVTLYLYDHPEVGRQKHVLNTQWPGAAGMALALDTETDLVMIRHVLSRLQPDPIKRGLREVCEAVDAYLGRSPWDGRHGPLLIAEIGGNHEGDYAAAQRLAELAIHTGVDYVKFQLYRGDTLVSSMEDPQRNAHFKRFELTPEQHLALARQCRLGGVGYMASVWDPAFIPWIDPHLAIYKIGSGDLTAYPMLERIAAIGKPIILATGLSTLAEVKEAVQCLQSVNPMYRRAERLALLQCTSMYPIPAGDANLACMDTLRRELGLAVGYSDHTEGTLALRVAAAMGAEVLEFHFTDSREGKTFRDHKVSLTPDEVSALQADLDQIRLLRGDGVKRPLPSEIDAGHLESFRRGVYAGRDVPAGGTLTEADLVCLRPNRGIDARELRRVVGKTTTQSLQTHANVRWNNVIA